MRVVNSRFAILLGISFEEPENRNIYQGRVLNLLNIYDGELFLKKVNDFQLLFSQKTSS